MSDFNESLEREEIVNSIIYFWLEKGDLERWCNWGHPDITKYFPEVVKLWNDYKMAEKILSTIVKGLE